MKSKKNNLPKFGDNKRAILSKKGSNVSDGSTGQSLTQKYEERKRKLAKSGGLKQPINTTNKSKVPVGRGSYH